MGQTTNKLLIILVVLYSYFFCHYVTGLDNTSTVSTRHEVGRRVLASYVSLFRVARTFFKKTPPAFQKLKGAFKQAPVEDLAQQMTEFYLENGEKMNFTQDDAIDYLNCQCECPFFQLDGACVQEANYNTCTAPQQLYCSYFQDNPLPLKCLTCSLILPTAPSVYSVPSSASPLSDFVHTPLMMISTTASIIILIMKVS